jgi:hypothetical protein
MIDEPQTAQELHDSIVASRGGAARFTPEQMRIVHALVSALARKPSDIDPQLVTRLRDMLPPLTSAPVADLSKLTNEQFNALEQIMSVACGIAPGDPLPPDEPPHEPSPREIEAVHLAHLLDAAEARGGQLSERELIDVRNTVLVMILPLCTGSRLFAPYAPASQIDLDTVGISTQPQPEYRTSELPNGNARMSGSERASNIVPLRNGGTSQWAGLAEVNSHWNGVYQTPDRFDANGRRLDADGLPQTRRRD